MLRLIPHRTQWLLALLALVALYGPSLLQHVVRSADPAAWTADATQHVAPYVAPQPAADAPAGYIDRYFVACHPVGYRALYQAWSAWADPRQLSKGLPYLLLLATLAGLAAAACRWGGVPAGLAVMLLALSADAPLSRMVGGLPRSFAFPLLAGLLAAAVHGRLRLLAGLSVVAMALYPVVAVPGLLSLAMIALLLPAADRGEAADWSLRRRLLLVALAGLAALGLALPTLRATVPFGPALMAADLAQFPEAGPGGRLQEEDRVTYARPLSRCLSEVLPRTYRVRGEPWVPGAVTWLYQRNAAGATPRAEGFFIGLGVLSLAGLVRGAGRDAGVRRMLALLLAALVGYLLARLAAPRLFLPERHVAYSLPVFALVLPVVSAALLWPRRAGWAAALAAAVILVCSGGRVLPRNGFDRPYDGQDTWMRAVAHLPPDALLAGWPPVVDPVPYLTGRRVLLSRETALPYHRAFTLELRRRTEALARAYFATSPGPLQALRDEFGVTHLVVYRPHFDRPPQLPPPFRHLTRSLVSGRSAADYEVLQRWGDAIYRDAEFAVIPLGVFGPAAHPAP
jgi:hypothetical protein